MEPTPPANVYVPEPVACGGSVPRPCRVVRSLLHAVEGVNQTTAEHAPMAPTAAASILDQIRTETSALPTALLALVVDVFGETLSMNAGVRS